ncbi:MAG: hypothetical protein QOD65_4060 [Gaiellales bacterium]|nr:hypothetical protein [Gaiellales bacterium]
MGQILALRALGLGDFLTGIPALRALKRAFPQDRLLLAAPLSLDPLVRLSGAIDELIATPGLERPPALDAREIEVAVNLHGRGPRSHRVLNALAPRRLVGFESEAGPTDAHSQWRADEHEVVRWCRLLGEAGIPADPADLELLRPARPAPPWTHGATIVHPGAAAPARRWPAERFAAIARAERQAGRRIVVTGGPAERDLALRVAHAAGLPSDVVAAGRTDVSDLAALVAVADRVLCGDTGISHLATALGRPSLTLCGPVGPDRWGPPPARVWHRTIWKGRSGDPHGRVPDPGLLAITVQEVLDELGKLPPPAPQVIRRFFR